MNAPRYCTLCKNHCALEKPKCSGVRDIMVRKAADDAGDDICAICGNRCPYTDLKCETGRTMARIKGKC